MGSVAQQGRGFWKLVSVGGHPPVPDAADEQQPADASSSAGISNNPFAFLGRPDKNFAPRLGFAYQLAPNTVLRGAFGLYFNLLPASYMGEMFGNLPYTASLTYTTRPPTRRPQPSR